jgi:hypothetical protein
MKKFKLTQLSKIQLNQVKGGNPGAPCAGCLCDADVSGQVSTNNDKATSKA